MRSFLRTVLSVLLLGCAVISHGTISGVQASAAPDIIVTVAPVYLPLAALKGKERFPQGAQLMRLHQGKAAPLVPGFFATADAQVSFDGQFVLFAAKPSAGDLWQIWEQPLAGGEPRKLIAGAADAIRPLYLPFGQFVFALRAATGFQLDVAGMNAHPLSARIDSAAGEHLLQLSHVPGNTVPADVLRDGRILLESVYPLGEGATPEMYLVYSDGSGVESYRCDHGSARWGGHQLESGDVVFTHGATLARFTSPQAHEMPVAAPRADYAGDIVETAKGEWLLSARASAASHFALRCWKPGTPATAQQTVLAVKDRDVVEPVIAAPRPRPNHHPTALHPWNYANQLALDVRLSRDGNLTQLPARVRLETLDSQGNVGDAGTAPIEADGSFFVQTPADRAIRFVLLDAKGSVVRREKGWFWIRSGEQRICTGCHAGPERASENRVPAILLKSTTPANLTGVNTASQAQAGTPGGK
jgi:hypothetical protein